MGSTTAIHRRRMLERSITSGLLLAGTALTQPQLLAFYQAGERQAGERPLTPKDVLGPFYRKGAPDTRQLRAAGAPGFPLGVKGNVTGTNGRAIPDARVELWHADHIGRYDTLGYNYRAKLAVDAKGLYTVETVMPGHYGDRPAQHIHYLISAPGHKTLITQAYFATDPYFEGDPARHWNKNGLVSHRDLILPVKLFEGPERPRIEITFDIVLEKA